MFNVDETLMYSCSDDFTVKIWDIVAGTYEDIY